MKTTSLLITIAAAITTLAVTTNAETQNQNQAKASTQAVSPVSVQYGQGGAVTFFKPAALEFKVAVYKEGQVTSAAPQQAEKKLQWRSQSIPNGGTITYSIVEQSSAARNHRRW